MNYKKQQHETTEEYLNRLERTTNIKDLKENVLVAIMGEVLKVTTELVGMLPPKYYLEKDGKVTPIDTETPKPINKEKIIRAFVDYAITDMEKTGEVNGVQDAFYNDMKKIFSGYLKDVADSYLKQNEGEDS